MPLFASLVDLLRHRAEAQTQDRAFCFLDQRGAPAGDLTYGELWARAAGVADDLRARARLGDRALLVYPPGLEFLVGYFGCLMAGLAPAPLMPPRRAELRDSSAAIAADCRARVALTASSLIGDLRARLPGVATGGWIATDAIPARSAGSADLRIHDIALLQYTSGSTSQPKGVEVAHANLLANLAMIETALGNGRGSRYASWTPLYHDMGLILNALQALYVGAPCWLLAPVAFVQRPLLWLEIISRHRVEVAGGPNFGFDHCVDRFRPEAAEGLDLSCWRVAFNGAEPVRAATMERFARAFAPYGFRASAFYPCYGMAEATLLISGGARGEGFVARAATQGGPPVVACGRALPGEAIAIVDPDLCRRRAPEAVGEIWVRGPHVARGYFGADAATEATFRATIDGEDGAWLRTGDLGFLDAEGRLFVVGRIKDLIIIRGVNHYPQDIERTVEEYDPALNRHGGAAFAVEGARGEDALVVVQEVARAQRSRVDIRALEDRVREAIVEAHEIAPRAVVLIRPGSLPKTTSGKIQRAAARRLFLEHRLDLWEGAPAAAEP